MLNAILEVFETEQRNSDLFGNVEPEESQELLFESAAGVILAAHAHHTPKLFSSLFTNSRQQLDEAYRRSTRNKKNEAYSINLWGDHGFVGKTVVAAGTAGLATVPLTVIVEELALLRDMARLFSIKYNQQVEANKRVDGLRKQQEIELSELRRDYLAELREQHHSEMIARQAEREEAAEEEEEEHDAPSDETDLTDHDLEAAAANAEFDLEYIHYEDILSTSGIGALFCVIQPFAAFAVDNLPSTRERIHFEEAAAGKGEQAKGNRKIDPYFIPSASRRPFNIFLELIDLLSEVLKNHGRDHPKLVALVCETLIAVSDPTSSYVHEIKIDMKAIVQEHLKEQTERSDNELSLEGAAIGSRAKTAADQQQNPSARKRSYYAESIHTGAEILRFLMCNPNADALPQDARACLCAAAVQLGVGFVFSPASGLLSAEECHTLASAHHHADESKSAAPTFSLKSCFGGLFSALSKATNGYVRPNAPSISSSSGPSIAQNALINAHWALVEICSQSLFLRDLDESLLFAPSSVSVADHTAHHQAMDTSVSSRRFISDHDNEGALATRQNQNEGLSGNANNSASNAPAAAANLPIFGITVGGNTLSSFAEGTSATNSFDSPKTCGPRQGGVAPLTNLSPTTDGGARNLAGSSSTSRTVVVSPPAALVASLVQSLLTDVESVEMFAVLVESLFSCVGGKVEEQNQNNRNRADDEETACETVCALLYGSATHFIANLAPDVWSVLPRVSLPFVLEGYVNALDWGANKAAKGRTRSRKDQSLQYIGGQPFFAEQNKVFGLPAGFVAPECVWRHVRRSVMNQVAELSPTCWHGPEGAAVLAAYSHLMSAVRTAMSFSSASASISSWLRLLQQDVISVARGTIGTSAPYPNAVHDDQMKNLIVVCNDVGGEAVTTIASHLLQKTSSSSTLANTNNNSNNSGLGGGGDSYQHHYHELEASMCRGCFSLSKKMLEATAGFAHEVEIICGAAPPLPEFMRDFSFAIFSQSNATRQHSSSSVQNLLRQHIYTRLQHEACELVVEIPHIFENVPLLISTLLSSDALRQAFSSDSTSLVAAKYLHLVRYLCDSHPESLRAYAVDIVIALASQTGGVGSAVATAGLCSTTTTSTATFDALTADAQLIGVVSAAAAPMSHPNLEAFTSAWVALVHDVVCCESYDVLSLFSTKGELSRLKLACDSIGVCAMNSAFAAARTHQLVLHSQDTSISIGATDGGNRRSDTFSSFSDGTTSHKCPHTHSKARDVLLKSLEILAVVSGKRPVLCAAGTVSIVQRSSSSPVSAGQALPFSSAASTSLSFVVVLLSLLFEANTSSMAQTLTSILTDALVNASGGQLNSLTRTTIPSEIRKKLQKLIEKRLRESSFIAAAVTKVGNSNASKTSSTTTSSVKQDGFSSTRTTTTTVSSVSSSTQLNSKSLSAPTREPSAARDDGLNKDATQQTKGKSPHSPSEEPSFSPALADRTELSYARIAMLRTLYGYDNALFYRLMQPSVSSDDQNSDNSSASTPASSSSSIEWLQNALEAIVKNNHDSSAKEATEALAFLMELHVGEQGVVNSIKSIALGEASVPTVASSVSSSARIGTSRSVTGGAAFASKSNYTTSSTSGTSDPLSTVSLINSVTPSFLVDDGVKTMGNEEIVLWHAIRNGNLDALFDNEQLFCTTSLPRALWVAQLSNFKVKAAISSEVGKTTQQTSAPASASTTLTDAAASAYWLNEKEKDGVSSLAPLASTVEALADITAHLVEECAVAALALSSAAASGNNNCSTTIGASAVPDCSFVYGQRHSYLGDGSVLLKYPLSSSAATVGRREVDSFNTRVLLEAGAGGVCDGEVSKSYVGHGHVSGLSKSSRRGYSALGVSLLRERTPAVDGDDAHEHDYNTNATSQSVALVDGNGLARAKEKGRALVLAGSSDSVSKSRATSGFGGSHALSSSSRGVANSIALNPRIVPASALEITPEEKHYHVKKYPTVFGSNYAISGTQLDALYNVTLSVVEVLTRVLRAVEAALLPACGGSGASSCAAMLTEAQLHQLHRILSQSVRIAAVVGRKYNCPVTCCRFTETATQQLSHQACLVITASATIIANKLNAMSSGSPASLARFISNAHLFGGCGVEALIGSSSPQVSLMHRALPLPTPQQLLEASQLVLANIRDRQESVHAQLVAVAGGPSTKVHVVGYAIKANVWARAVHSVSLVLRVIDIIDFAAGVVVASPKQFTHYPHHASITNNNDSPIQSPTPLAVAALAHLATDGRKLRKDMGDALLTMMAKWVSQHQAETEVMRAVALAVEYSSSSPAAGSSLTSANNNACPPPQTSTSTRLMYEILAVVIGNAFAGGISGTGAGGLKFGGASSPFVRAAQLVNPRVFMNDKNDSNSEQADGLLSSCSRALGGDRTSVASPAAATLVKTIWRYIMLSSADAHPAEAVKIDSNAGAVNYFGLFADEERTATSATSAAATTPAGNLSPSSGPVSQTMHSASSIATSSGASSDNHNSFCGASSFSMALEALMTVLAAIPTAAYHLEIDGIVSLLSILGNNYEADTALAPCPVPSTPSPSGGNAPANATSVGEIPKTPQVRPTASPQPSSSPATIPNAATFTSSPAKSIGSSHIFTTTTTPASVTASMLSQQPRQAQWHRAWLQMIRLSLILVEGATLKFIHPITLTLANSKRIASLTTTSVLSAFVIGKAARPTAEQCLELSMLTTLITTIIRKRKIGGALEKAFPSISNEIDVASLYPFVRRSFMWLSAHHKAFRKPINSLMITHPPHAGAGQSQATSLASSSPAANTSATATSALSVGPSPYITFASRDWLSLLGDLLAALLSAPIVSVHDHQQQLSSGSTTSSAAATAAAAAFKKTHPLADLISSVFTTHVMGLAPHEGFLTFETLFMSIQELSAIARRLSRKLHLLTHTSMHTMASISATPRAVGIGGRGASPARLGPAPQSPALQSNPSGLDNVGGHSSSFATGGLLVHEEGDESALLLSLTDVCTLLRQSILLYVAHWQFFVRGGAPASSAEATTLPSSVVRTLTDAQERLSTFIFNFSRDFLDDGHIKSGLPDRLELLLRTLEKIVLLFENANSKH